MGINEMEFQWRLNWWYRPNQLDDFGTSVTDYYEYFCDWKDSMILNSCPADETDYVFAFIQNLRGDIRSRLESKGRLSTRRLNDVFYDAKLEECLITLEENFKKFEARNLAPRIALADKNEVKEVIKDEEISGQEITYNAAVASMGDILLSTSPSCDSAENSRFDIDDISRSWKENSGHNDADEVFEQIPNREFEHSDEKSDNALDGISCAATKEEAVIELDNVPYEMTNSSPTGGTITSINEVGQLSASQEKGVKYGPHLFEEMPMSIPTVEAFKMVEKSTEAILLGLKSNQEVMKVGHKLLDEMPMLFSIIQYGEINGDMDFIPLIDCVPRVFDPGTSTILHNELFRPRVIATTCSKSIYGQCPSFASFLGQCESILSFTSTDMVCIFDPGGYGEPVGFWIEGVVGTLYCHLVECLVRCMWSHIISLVDEMKRGDMENEECCKLFCMTNGVVGSPLLNNGCNAINRRSNAFEFRVDWQFSSIKVGSILGWLCFGYSIDKLTVQVYASKPFDIDFDIMAEGAAILRKKMLDLGVWKGYFDRMRELIAGEKILGSVVCWPTLRYETAAPGGSLYHMRYRHFMPNGVIHQGNVQKDEITLEHGEIVESTFVVIMLAKNKSSSAEGPALSTAPTNVVQDTYSFEFSSAVAKSKWVLGLLTNYSMFSTQAVSWEEIMVEVSSTNISSMLKLVFDPQVFDPGIDIHLRTELVNQVNANEGQLNDLSSMLSFGGSRSHLQPNKRCQPETYSGLL